MARASAGVMSAARTAVSASTVASAATRTVFVFIVVVFRARAETFFTRFSHPSFYLFIGLETYRKNSLRLIHGPHPKNAACAQPAASITPKNICLVVFISVNPVCCYLSITILSCLLQPAYRTLGLCLKNEA